MQNPQWHALLVKRHFERVVTLHLHKQGIENYLPVLRADSRLGAGMDSSQSPLFPGYVFCKCDAPSSEWSIPGVVSMLQGTNGIEAEEEITNLRRILAAGLRVQPWAFASEGSVVTIEDGALTGVSGVLQETGDKRAFVFSIRLIRHSIAISEDSLTQNSSRSGAVGLFSEARAS